MAKIVFQCMAMMLLVWAGCIREEQYPLEPVIAFNEFATLKDVSGKDSIGAFTINYTDGDGDIGLQDADTLDGLRYNYFMRIFQHVNGQEEEVLPIDSSSSFNGRIPYLTPNGRNKNIKGDITLYIELYYMRQALKSDTIAFEVYIQDRALHSSNVVRTPWFLMDF